MDRDKILVVATWGLPSSWARFKYVVEIDHPAFKDVGRLECETKCSTLAIWAYLSRKFDVDILIFGTDTIIDPRDSGDLRKTSHETYRKYLEQFLGDCNCCRDLAGTGNVEIDILPGIGHYYGWRFQASVDNVYNQAFYKIFQKLSNARYKWIVVDLTHGINYMMLTVLYATIANAIVHGLEENDRVVLLNSEPARPRVQGRNSTISGPSGWQDAQHLAILDVRRLQVAIRLIRSLAQLKKLSFTSLDKTILKELSRVDESLYNTLNKKTLPFFTLLGNAIIALTFTGSYVTKDGRETPISTALCGEGLKDPKGEFEYYPGVDDENKAVRYKPALIYASTSLALKKIVEDVCKDISSLHLADYLNKVGKYYERAGLLYASWIVKNTAKDLGKVVMFVKKAGDHLVKCGFAVKHDRECGNCIEVGGRILKAVWEKDVKKLKGLAEKLGKTGEGEDACRLLEAELGLREAESKLEKKRKAILSEDKPERELRNLSAHAGLNYISIDRLIIDLDAGDVVKIVYDRDILERIIKSSSIFEQIEL